VKSEPGPAATLGSTAAARVRIIIWCKACGDQTEPNPAVMAERYGAIFAITRTGSAGFAGRWAWMLALELSRYLARSVLPG
jgi:hypothetical protein